VPSPRCGSDVDGRSGRNQFFLVWIGWLVVGGLLWWLYSLVTPADYPMLAGPAALVTWGLFWFWVARRLTNLRCSYCGEQAFSHPYFLMSHAKCKNCGVSYGCG
jgi:hypothetical protein